MSALTGGRKFKGHRPAQQLKARPGGRRGHSRKKNVRALYLTGSQKKSGQGKRRRSFEEKLSRSAQRKKGRIAGIR